ncbi:MAG: carbohydrate-binding domain-containing protein [Ruminococcaceae bacterium]|nr:carbohydrate-binding domain-containing protein [Oscillospiraceae bacterium]
MEKYLALFVAFALLVSMVGCGGKTPQDPADDPGNGTGITDPSGGGEADFTQTDSEMFTDRDLQTAYDAAAAVSVELQGTSAQASSDSVKVEDGTVRLTQEATYVLSGTLTDGMLVVDAPDTAKLHLIFDGVNITSETSAALYILEADKVVVTLAEGSENTLANGGSFVAIDENNIDGALFSKQDLTFNGSGSLTVTSPAGHGIVCKDDLVLVGGSYQISAASHGVDANDSIRIKGITLQTTAGKDGLHAENTDDANLGFVYLSGGTLKLEAEGDGISAGNYLHMTGGNVDVLAGGGSENGQKQSSENWGGFMGGNAGGGGMRPDGGTRPGGTRPGGNSYGGASYTAASSSSADSDSSTSMKGLKAGGDLMISGGDLVIDSADDALHANGSMTVDGGSFEIASGDDALHAEDTLTVNSGTIRISECYEGLEALHIAVSGGDVKLAASDDGINAAGGTDASGTTGGRDGMFGGGGMMSGNSSGSIVISGGTLYINSSGDGIDANGTLEISGGHTTVVGPTQGDTATLDYDRSAVISGGTFIGTGSSMMAQTFSEAKQGVFAVSVGNQSAGTEIVLTDAAGNEVIRYTPELNYQVVILSSPDIVSGASYTITVGTQSGTFEAD